MMMRIKNQEFGIKHFVAIVVFVMALGGLGGIVIERYVIPVASHLPILRKVISFDRNAPLVITRREEIRINEGINHAEVVNSVKNGLVSVYFYEGTLGGARFRPITVRTGLVITSDGVVAMPGHGINTTLPSAILLPGDSLRPATILGYDNLSEIVFLKIDKANLPIVRQGFSKPLSVGDKALAIWRGEGERTVSVAPAVINSQPLPKTGFSTMHELDKWNSSLPVDLNLNSSHLGAVIANRSGELVGVVTGVGNRIFVLRAEDLKLVISNFLDDRKTTWPVLKLNYLLVEAGDAAALGLPGMPGVLVKSGGGVLENNDFIYAVDGRSATAEFDFQNYILAKSAGEKVKLKLLRGAEDMELEWVL